MKRLKSNIRIAASRQAIWAILMETTDYPDWNPLWKEAKGSWEEDQRMRLELQVADKSKTISPKVLKRLEYERLEWQRTNWLWSFDCWEQLILLSEHAEETVVTHHIYYGGWANSMSPKAYQVASLAFLKALKTRVE